jgi:hypothetical protein
VGKATPLIVLGEPEREPEPSLDNPINLSPRQTTLLLHLLDRYEDKLVPMSEEEQENRDDRLWKACRILVDAARQTQRKRGTS